MAGNDASGKFYDALNEGSDAIIDAIRAANDRNHRFATALIEEAQERQREGVDLAKKWIAAPFDFVGISSSLIESSTKSQGRALDVTRQLLTEASDIQKETRQVLERVTSANRTAGEATVEIARGAVSRATQAVATAADGNGRKASREAPKSSSPDAKKTP